VSANAILASVLLGAVGMGFFAYGKRQKRLPHLIAGIALMVYPYFVPNVLAMLLIGVALTVLLYAATYVGL
jgi:hypothetical protein